MEIKFAELNRQFLKYQNEYEKTVLKVLRSGWYIMGEELEKFELNFAKYHNISNCIGVGNGLDSLRLALTALGIGKGDEVIVQANTFIATALAITENGATPVFVDSDDYFGIDINKIEDAITEKTKAIMVVHLYGQMCDMDVIINISKKYNLYIIEDCAQAHGATYKGKMAGTIGNVGCFSFYPMKPVGAFGDAGAVITNDNTLAQRIRKLRNYGSVIKYKHEVLGINSRMDEIQAAIVGINLQHLEAGNTERRTIAAQYLNKINNPKVSLPKLRPGTEHVFHVFAIRIKERQKLHNYLSENGIQTQVHYPIPCHLAECYSYLNYKEGDFKKSELSSNEELSLPIYVGLKQEEIDYIIDVINNY